VKLAKLKAWLHGREWAPPTDIPERIEGTLAPRDVVHIAGVKVSLSREEVFAQARKALAEGQRGSQAYRHWYVLIDGKAVASKWLVSLISGRPTSAFDSSAARKALVKLGISVERVANRRGIQR
jgi:hypothetical protein